MRGDVRSIQILVLGVVASTGACGGGGGTGGVQPPPPQPDFVLELSATSVSVSQGSTSPPLSVSIHPNNGFSATVQVSFSGLPSGVTTQPAGPFPVASGQSVSVLFGAATNAPTGQFSFMAQGTGGALSHSQGLSLAVLTSTSANLPLTSFVENDSVASLDSPPGDPHRRHVVFDSVNQRFYVASLAMNRVEVFAAVNRALQATIAAPGASSVDLSADGSALWVGTTLEQILAVDTSSLQVKARFPVPGLSPIPGAVFIRPTDVLALSSGSLLVRLRQAGANQALLALRAPSSNAFTNLTSVAPAVFQNGAGVLARSSDHSRVLTAANDSSGELAIFDSNGNLIAGPLAPLAGAISAAAANSNGSSFAVAINAGGVAQVLLLDAGLNLLGSYASTGAVGLVFSLDGQSLYVAEPYGNSGVVSVLSGSNLQKLGQISDIVIQGVPTSIEEVGASSNLCGLGNRGVAFLDVTQTGSLPPAAPVFSAVPAALPSEGPAAGGTTLAATGTNFSSSPQVRFGATNPVNSTAASGSQVQVISPASTAVLPVNLTAYFPNGWIALAPAAFSYSPSIVRVLPNAGTPQGGDTVTVLGYGFGASAGSISATLAGQSANIQSVDALPTFASSLGLDVTYPFALERIVLVTPPGSPGKADLTIQSPVGSVTAAKAFQYLASSQTYANAALHKFVVYDQSRQNLYLSATDHVDVFNLNTQVFASAIEPPPNGPPPDAALRGLALTPDATQLAVADFGAQSVYLIDPDGAAYNGTAVSVGGVAGFLNSGPARVTATSAQTLFVGLSGEGSSTGPCNGCLGQMNLLANPPAFQPAPQPEVSSLTGTPLLQADAAGDTAYLAYDTGRAGRWRCGMPRRPTCSRFPAQMTRRRTWPLPATARSSPCARTAPWKFARRTSRFSRSPPRRNWKRCRIAWTCPESRCTPPARSFTNRSLMAHRPPRRRRPEFTAAWTFATRRAGSFACVFTCRSLSPC
jgi:hypothetical protein